MFNTIILKKGYAKLTESEFAHFEKGDTIWGTDRFPEEIKRWSIEQKEKAREELAKYKCSYVQYGCLWNIEEYALEYCECDEDGGFVEGSDFDLAERENL